MSTSANPDYFSDCAGRSNQFLPILFGMLILPSLLHVASDATVLLRSQSQFFAGSFVALAL